MSAGADPLTRGHRKIKRRYVPEVMVDTNWEFTNWRRDALPDMLWLAFVLFEHPIDAPVGPLRAVFDLADEALAKTGGAGPHLNDGLLTSLEQFPREARSFFLESVYGLGLADYALPEAFVNALQLYPDAPGRWLIEREIEAGHVVDERRAEVNLAQIVSMAGRTHDPLATQMIFVWVSRLSASGKLHMATQDEVWTRILPRYPNVEPDERNQAEATLRALFGGAFWLQDERPQSKAWARTFWLANNRFGCIPGSTTPLKRGNRRATSTRARRFERDLNRITDEATLNLYDPDRSDVLLGITAKAVRIAAHMARTPELWSREHGQPALRAIAEGAIYMRWMLKNEATRPEVYRLYKEYGRGRMKAQKMHIEDMIEADGAVAAEKLAKALAEVTGDVNRDIDERWVSMSKGSTFVDGINLGQMASEVGLERIYNGPYAMGSSAIHGDWSAIDGTVLVPCQHPLHNGHRVQRPQAARQDDRRIPDMVLDAAGAILGMYEQALKAEPLAVDAPADPVSP